MTRDRSFETTCYLVLIELGHGLRYQCFMCTGMVYKIQIGYNFELETPESGEQGIRMVEAIEVRVLLPCRKG